MKQLSLFLLLLACPLLLSQCSWFKKEDLPPIDQLPPATQTGANTFGCLLNGQAWLPKGNDGTSNYSVTYDPGYYGGSFGIAVYQIADGKEQFIRIYSDSLKSVGTYSLENPKKGAATVEGSKLCTYDRNSTVYRKGNLVITKFDLTKGIISGTFEFTLAKPGCDTIKVTNGRFDKKL